MLFKKHIKKKSCPLPLHHFITFIHHKIKKCHILFCLFHKMLYLCNQNKANRMRKILLFIVTLTLITFSSCSQKKAEELTKTIDTIPVMVMQIQECSRLYTTEVHVHKIITHDDQLNLKGSLFKKAFEFHVPASNRKVAIPLDATLKTYIDFKDFSTKNIKRNGEKIEIILPDPKITLTSSKIDHKGIKQFVSLTRSNFSDAELSKLELQGRQSIINDIPNIKLIEQAEQNAANTLIPMLKDIGFKEENIKITFRKKFTFDELKSLFDTSTIENKPSK